VGNALSNPFATGDLQGQSLLAKRDPMLAEWLKKFAESPYTAACEWADKQAAILTQKTLTYNSDTHLANPYVDGSSETEKARFHRNADPATVERCKWEAKPVTFPTAKNFDLTAQSKIASALWNAMTEREREYVMAAKAAAQQQRIEAEARLKQLEAASDAPPPPRLAQRARVGRE
jgi:hypothetical protein